jgi:bifunctional non-homologous end joining protein LigD
VSPETKVAVHVDGRTLTLTNLAKVLYPQTGFTKAEVLDYYQRVAPVLLPHITSRPLTLKRYPEGVDGEAFFQKHVTEHRPDWIRTAKIPSDSSRGRGTTVTYLVVDDLPALIWAANLAGLELHVPQWRLPELRRPDLLVFDLDPGAPANIVDCCRVAEDLRPLLEAEGFAPLAKTSGGKGLQLYAPISGVTSEQASDRARAFAERLERDQPRRVVSRMTKALRTGKVLIDWSQNNGSKTTVAPYSLRARQSPTVSTPVSWDEVRACRRPEELFFTAGLVLDRVDKHGDLFAPLVRLPFARSGDLLGFEFFGGCRVGRLPGPPVAHLLRDRGGPQCARDGQRDQGGQLVTPGELVQVRAEQHGDRAAGDQQAGQAQVSRIAAPAEGEDPGQPEQQPEQEHRSRRVPAVQLVEPQPDREGPADARLTAAP